MPTIDLTTGKETQSWAPLCIWCSAPWSGDNMRLEAWAGGYCSTCGSDPPEIKVTIACHECGKVMYEKEGTGSW